MTPSLRLYTFQKMSLSHDVVTGGSIGGSIGLVGGGLGGALIGQIGVAEARDRLQRSADELARVKASPVPSFAALDWAKKELMDSEDWLKTARRYRRAGIGAAGIGAGLVGAGVGALAGALSRKTP
jgi:hypothetical protein